MGRSRTGPGSPGAPSLALAGLAGLAAAMLPMPARAAAPMNYLQSYGPRADQIATLTWALLILSILVIVIIGGLVIAGVMRRRAPEHSEVRLEPVTHGSGTGVSWIHIGGGLSILALFGAMVWTGYTMAAVQRPPSDPKLTIEVIGHQWWWQLRYGSSDHSRVFDTANEIHIPVGEPVQFRVHTGDVIHSFWVPPLGDKLDLIPNQTNTTWLQASQPGTYRGQCAEFCGRQHAHMGLLVIADPPEQFQRWWDDQLKPASADPQTATGETLFTVRCGACHTVRGTRAGGRLGPDLTHLMSRQTIAAATLPNKLAYLSGWIADPQRIKPGNLMPRLDISGPELEQIRGFLALLK
jgi:cytochrome c oxidase subunit 2